MSVVLAYADDHIAVIASDGRVTDKNLNVIDENFNKTLKINDRTIMGFSGSFENCQNIIKLIQNPEHKSFIETLYPENIILFIRDILSDCPEGIKCSFIVCGIGKNGKICLSHVQTRSDAFITYPEPGKPHYNGAYPDEEIGKLDIFPQKLQQHFPDIQSAIYETIQTISELSPTVNKNMFHQIVRVD